MAAGAYQTVAQKRAHELNARAASLDHGALPKLHSVHAVAGNGTTTTTTSQSAEGIAAATAVAVANARAQVMAAGGHGSPAHSYFRPAHSEIRFGRMRFLVTDRPTDQNIESYVEELERVRTTKLVRVCESTYDTAPLTTRGIDVEDWLFADGQSPPHELTDKWMRLCAEVFGGHSENTIAVHDVAGLGRAPLLVGVALLEAGMKCEDAIFLIRSKRRGALNETQLDYLRQYKPSGTLRKLRYVEAAKERHKSCAIM